MLKRVHKSLLHHCEGVSSHPMLDYILSSHNARPGEVYIGLGGPSPVNNVKHLAGTLVFSVTFDQFIIIIYNAALT